MNADLFISYAWTSSEHREWVQLFASHLHLLGYDVKIDEAVNYGSSISQFMQNVTNSTHVLLILDENYVDRADNMPNSGVGIETKWISSVYVDKPASWLSVVFVRNPTQKMPVWLKHHNPKGFNFNSKPDKNEFPGAMQIDDVWRWVEGLPAGKKSAVPLSEVRKRSARLERVDIQCNPANYANPAVEGRATFQHRNHRDFTIGLGEYEFKINFSGRDRNSVYVYTDSGLKAMGLITDPKYDPLNVGSFLTPARTAEPLVGQSVVLMNSHGTLCIITIDEVEPGVNAINFVPKHVTFSYKILMPANSF